jgi:hypothetical protein
MGLKKLFRRGQNRIRLWMGHDLTTQKGYFIHYNTIQISKGDVEKIFADFTQLFAQDIIYSAKGGPNWLRPFYSFFKASLGHLFPTGHLFIYRK